MKRKWIIILGSLLVALAMVTACMPAAGPDSSSDPGGSGDPDPVPPGDLPEVPDGGLEYPAGAATFYAVFRDSGGATGLETSAISSPDTLAYLIDGQINPDHPFVRPNPDFSEIAYLNVNNELVIFDRGSGDSYLVTVHEEGAPNSDEFWWFSDDVLLFSTVGSISRAQIVDGSLDISTVLEGHSCYHDLSINPFSAVAGTSQVALSYITSSGGIPVATILVGTYSDDGTTGEITSVNIITTFVGEFGIDFDPMLTWLTPDFLVWRTSEDLTRVFYCDVPERLGGNLDAFGVVDIDAGADHPTDMLLSNDGSTVYLYGRGNSVTSVAVPTEPGSYDASVFYTDDIEYTVSKLAFAPSGAYFLVGNRSRLRCFNTSDPTIRYRWWEDTDLEAELDSGDLEVLEVWLR